MLRDDDALRRTCGARRVEHARGRVPAGPRVVRPHRVGIAAELLLADHQHRAEVRQFGSDRPDRVGCRGVDEHHDRCAVSELVDKKVATVSDVDRDRNGADTGATEPDVDELYTAFQEQRDGLTGAHSEVKQYCAGGPCAHGDVGEGVAHVVEPQRRRVRTLRGAILDQRGHGQPFGGRPSGHCHADTAPR